MALSGNNVFLAMQIGTDYREITGAGTLTFEPPEAPQNTNRAFRRSRQLTGTAEIGTMTIEVPSLITNTQVYNQLLASGTKNFRVETEEELIFTSASTAMAAIAVARDVTFSGTGDGSSATLLSEDRFGQGASIKIGSTYYLIDEIPHDLDGSSNKAKVWPAPSGAVAAGTFSIGIEKRQWNFTATVASFGGIGATTGDGTSVTSNLTLAPTSRLPAATLQGGF